ncbi:hypothetical protein [Swingsia samuiensis]|uniref:dATP pyrophosphohydrolase n=1 Tax=Swingsia samuiensis TaxID=1293412 RepID=A0A4Y6UNC9_9PROT|nr:hypothetical protein [Swingsia samuiensis]QDH17906.1 hypothetical protein E3D00_10230 [Swingsia samuiensis]
MTVPAPQDDLIVRPVTTRAHLKLFITLPRRLYKGMKGFVPPLDMEQTELLSPKKSPVFRHSSVRYFLAWRGKTPVGRVAAIVDHRAIEAWGEKIGSFGALDALPEQNIISALLDAAYGWLRLQGMERMRGPVTLSGNGESGLMIEGQDQPLMIAMPWHPKILGSLVEAAGYHKTEDLLSYKLNLTKESASLFKVPGDMRIGEGRLGSIAVKHLSKKQIAAQGEVLRTLYNDAWSKKYNFVPLQDYEMKALIDQVKILLKPEHYVQIDKDDVPVAMALVLPNLYDIVSDLGGSPSLLGWLKLGTRIAQHRFHSARVILLGVTSKLRGTMLGALLPSLAIAELLRRGESLPYSWVELGWILESDTGMKNLAEAVVPHPYKRYRLYEKTIDA